MGKDKEATTTPTEEQASTQATRKKSTRDPSVPRINTQELEERLARVEAAQVGINKWWDETVDKLDARIETFESLEERVDGAESAIEELKGDMLGTLNQAAGKLREEMALLMEPITSQLHALKVSIEAMQADIALCKTVVARGATTTREGPKIKVPEPPKFEGKRDSKVLDNFLWSVERYFEALHIDDDASMISTAIMYLIDDAVLWWRRRQEDIKKGTCSIATWDEFKKDIKRQFYPENAEEIAMRKLRGLKQTGSIRGYINEYSSLMLEIPDLEEKTRLIYFMDGLKRWAEQELRRRGVKTLAEAIAVAESLIEFQQDRDSERDKGRKVVRSDHGGEPSSHHYRPKVVPNKDKGQSYQGGREKGKLSCFLCSGEHMARNCPQRSKLSAIVAHLGEEESGAKRLGSMQIIEDEQPRLGCMRLLNATRVDDKPTEATNTKEVCFEPRDRLKYIKGYVNGGRARVLVDTGATHNFMALGKAKSLDVPYTRVDGEWKAVNTQAAPVCGRAYKVPISLGSWSGRVDFLVVDMDMEEVVLGLEFLRMMAPVQFDEGMLSITHNGKVFGIPMAASKENRARINSLRAWWMPKVGQQQASMVPREEHQCSGKGAHGRANGTHALKGNKAKGMIKGEQRPSGHDQAQGRGHTRQQKPQEGATRMQQVRKGDAPFGDIIARHHRPNKGANRGRHVCRSCTHQRGHNASY